MEEQKEHEQLVEISSDSDGEIGGRSTSTKENTNRKHKQVSSQITRLLRIANQPRLRGSVREVLTVVKRKPNRILSRAP